CYLRNKASESNQVIDYKDWQIALSRKFQSLKLWFVLRSYGLDNLRNFLRKHVKMGKNFENLVKQDKRFEVFVPRYFSLVCFGVSPSVIITKKPFRNGISDHELNGKIINDDDEHLVNEINSKLLDLINGSGKVFMTHGKVEGAFVIRRAIGATLTEEQHVIMAWETVQERATSILSKLFN
ncbi:tyrosine/DOPA decarboxylase 5-like, partial [Neltuma alba]|uniref:tyrosine/DOPA decarboxylase 5-like n=1 Tax=Neltuma alba TaxID=207710 RepID=UPI0010A52927